MSRPTSDHQCSYRSSVGVTSSCLERRSISLAPIPLEKDLREASLPPAPRRPRPAASPPLQVSIPPSPPRSTRRWRSPLPRPRALSIRRRLRRRPRLRSTPMSEPPASSCLLQ
ncbi:hypothetical protein DAI22_03g213650 [Oryza sativa Japonica Group]|nr:hypothetical protein DAI22_03g213650 [Oryza sativa Japonica Group]